MSRQRMCRTCGQWHDLELPWPCVRVSKSAAPNVISDNMDAIRHMGTGQILDSKSKFRHATKASGCIEIGNEPIKTRTPVPLNKGERREAIKKAIYDLRNGR